MRTLSTLLASLATLSPAVAQSQAPTNALQPIQGQVRHGGTYHVQTQTWTRGQSSIELGNASAIYRNSTPFVYFISWDTDGQVVDSGRIPTLGGNVANADRTEYAVNGFEFTLCTNGPASDSALWSSAFTRATCPAMTSTRRRCAPSSLVW